MDYDDLLVNLRDLLAGHETIRRQLSKRHRFVMVDEYQDTNRLQAHIAALLASEHGNLMVVGDDAQSIYSFRGADFRNIMDFQQIFPDCKVTLLEQNYRSTQPILDLGNAILRSSRERFEKSLYTRIEGDTRPLFVRTPDDHDQAIFVCERILELREEGVPLAEMAVLARAAWHTATLEIELQRRNIPFRKFGGIKFVEAAHVKDVSALLRLALNPVDGSSWLRVLQLLEGIGPRRAQQMTELVVRSRGDFESAFTTHLRAARYGRGLRELCDALRALDGQGPVSEQIDGALAFYRPCLQRKYDDALRRGRDLEALSVLAERYRSLERFLTDIAIEAPDFGRDPEIGGSEDEWITVSTIHSAKGLEWTSVFVLHLVNGQFPGVSAADDADLYEEERRLLYVAVTRCKRDLFLLKPEVAPRRGWMGGVAELSPLITDIEGFSTLTESKIFAARVDDDPTTLAAGAGDGEAAEGLAAAGERLRRIQDYFDR